MISMCSSNKKKEINKMSSNFGLLISKLKLFVSFLHEFLFRTHFLQLKNGKFSSQATCQCLYNRRFVKLSFKMDSLFRFQQWIFVTVQWICQWISTKEMCDLENGFSFNCEIDGPVCWVDFLVFLFFFELSILRHSFFFVLSSLCCFTKI